MATTRITARPPTPKGLYGAAYDREREKERERMKRQATGEEGEDGRGGGGEDGGDGGEGGEGGDAEKRRKRRRRKKRRRRRAEEREKEGGEDRRGMEHRVEHSDYWHATHNDDGKEGQLTIRTACCPDNPPFRADRLHKQTHYFVPIASTSLPPSND